jgi:hypothetical protein
MVYIPRRARDKRRKEGKLTKKAAFHAIPVYRATLYLNSTKVEPGERKRSV